MSEKFSCKVFKAQEPDFAHIQITINKNQSFICELQEEDLILLYDTIGKFLTHAGTRNYIGKDERVSVLEQDLPL